MHIFPHTLHDKVRKHKLCASSLFHMSTPTTVGWIDALSIIDKPLLTWPIFWLVELPDLFWCFEFYGGNHKFLTVLPMPMFWVCILTNEVLALATQNSFQKLFLFFWHCWSNSLYAFADVNCNWYLMSSIRMCYLLIHMSKLRLWKADSLVEKCCIFSFFHTVRVFYVQYTITDKVNFVRCWDGFNMNNLISMPSDIYVRFSIFFIARIASTIVSY